MPFHRTGCLIATMVSLIVIPAHAADPFSDLLLGAARSALGVDSIVRDADANVRANEEMNREMEAEFRKDCAKNTVFCGAAVNADGTVGPGRKDSSPADRLAENTWPWVLSFNATNGTMLQQLPVIAEPITAGECEHRLPSFAEITINKAGYDPDIIKLSDTQWTDYDPRFGLIVQVFHCGTMTSGNRMQLLPGRSPPQPMLKEARAIAAARR